MPQRSPFRYPGGKTWLIPELRAWLAHTRPRLFVEPFAGGGTATLTAVAEGLTEQALMVESDPQVAAVWATVFSSDAEALARRIETFPFNRSNVVALLETDPVNRADVAFATIVRNRVQRGGIIAPGAGLMKSGESGKGLGSRWYPATLAKRVRAAGQMRDRISFVHGDGLACTAKHLNDRGAVFFFDPPYTAGGKRAGARLYSDHQVDHSAVFAAGAAAAGGALLTYDDAVEVRGLADKYRIAATRIGMMSGHNRRMRELLLCTAGFGWLPEMSAAEK